MESTSSDTGQSLPGKTAAPLRSTAIALVCALLVGACSGGDPSSPPGENPPDPPPGPPTDMSGSWQSAAPLPEPIQEFHAAVLDGRIYVAGGIFQGDAISPRMYRYDPEADAWDRVADLFEPRHHMPLVVAADSLYAVGGLGLFGFTPEDNLWVYLVEEDRWEVRAGMSIARGASAAVALDDRIYVLGGYTHGPALVDLVEVYDPATGEWSSVTPLPSPRDHLAAAVLDGLIYVVGGRTVAAGSTLSVVHRYDPETDEWDQVRSLPSATAGHAAVALGNRIHVFGGEWAVGPAFDLHVSYDPEENVWVHRPALPTGRHGMAAATIGGRIYTIGGGPQAGFSQSAVVEVFNPD